MKITAPALTQGVSYSDRHGNVKAALVIGTLAEFGQSPRAPKIALRDAARCCWWSSARPAAHTPAGRSWTRSRGTTTWPCPSPSPWPPLRTPASWARPGRLDR